MVQKQDKQQAEIVIPTFAEDLLRNTISQLEHNYELRSRAEMETLHNLLAESITKTALTPEKTLLVLELIKQEILADCLRKYFPNK